jgi:hypothetical protein
MILQLLQLILEQETKMSAKSQPWSLARDRVLSRGVQCRAYRLIQLSRYEPWISYTR